MSRNVNRHVEFPLVLDRLCLTAQVLPSCSSVISVAKVQRCFCAGGLHVEKGEPPRGVPPGAGHSALLQLPLPGREVWPAQGAVLPVRRG